MYTDPIIITGCPRSGTSLTAGIISACGAFSGITQGPTINNSKGFFENLDVRNLIIKKYLLSIGADTKCQEPLPSKGVVEAGASSESTVAFFRDGIMNIMRAQGYTGGRWFLKEPKILPLWKIFRKAFPKAVWVLTKRLEEDTAASCMRTSFMTAFRNIEGWRSWVRRYTESASEAASSLNNRFIVYPQRIINQYIESSGKAVPEHAEELLNFTGLECGTDPVLNFISPEMWPPTKENLKNAT